MVECGVRGRGTPDQQLGLTSHNIQSGPEICHSHCVKFSDKITLDLPPTMSTDQVIDPLRSLDNDEAEDLFKSAFNGSAGVLKITKTAPQIDSYQEKFDPPKPVDLPSPEGEEDDLFSDCRSEVGSEAGVRRVSCPRTPGDEAGPGPGPGPGYRQDLEGSFREKLSLMRGPVMEQEMCGEEMIRVTVEDPHRVGEGISSYTAYRVVTRTNIRCFRRASFSVVRRYSDFLGLHEKLVARYQSKGRIIPPAPEKSIIGTYKIVGSWTNSL